MADEATEACIREWGRSGRPIEDLHLASLIAAALLGVTSRIAGHLPVEVWAEAVRLALDETSLINLSPVAPATKAIHG